MVVCKVTLLAHQILVFNLLNFISIKMFIEFDWNIRSQNEQTNFFTCYYKVCDFPKDWTLIMLRRAANDDVLFDIFSSMYVSIRYPLEPK